MLAILAIIFGDKEREKTTMELDSAQLLGAVLKPKVHELKKILNWISTFKCDNLNRPL